MLANKRDKAGHAVMGTHLVDFQQKVAGKTLPEGWVHKWDGPGEDLHYK